MRDGGELVLPQVAVLAGVTVGYATFSAVRLSPAHDGWYGLGPVAVAPDFQGLRIGSALIDGGLNALKAMGAAGCVVLGEPRFYRRFGFEQSLGVTFDGAPPNIFWRTPFVDHYRPPPFRIIRRSRPLADNTSVRAPPSSVTLGAG